jgi:hypothetical protein
LYALSIVPVSTAQSISPCVLARNILCAGTIPICL